MKIAKEYPQFENKKALILVTGKQEAIFYFASNGEIEKIKEIKIENPHYSDKEGFFATKTKGAERTGSVLEPKKWKVINEFNKGFIKELKAINPKEIDILYIFSPDYLHKIIEKELPASYKKKLKKIVDGDFCHEHPFEILKRI